MNIKNAKVITDNDIKQKVKLCGQCDACGNNHNLDEKDLEMSGQCDCASGDIG